MTALDPERCLSILLPYLRRSEEAEVVLSVVRTLQRFVSRVPSPTLLKSLPEIMPTLVGCFSSPNVDMRKSVVFALVEAYFVLGDSLMPHLAGLNAAQLKLITIYVERQQKARGPGEGGGERERTTPCSRENKS